MLDFPFASGFSASVSAALWITVASIAGSLLLLLGAWFGIAWLRRRDIPKTKWFLRAVSVSGVRG